jgi:hypothetical protein
MEELRDEFMSVLRIGHAALHQIQFYWEEDAKSSRLPTCALFTGENEEG